MQTAIVGLVAGGIYGLLALGLVLVHRGARVLNFAAIEVGTASLYVAYWLIVELELPWLVGGIGAVAFAALIGVVFERLVVRRMGDGARLAVAVATVGLYLLCFSVELRAFGGAPRSLPPPIDGDGVEISGVVVTSTQLLALVVTIAVGLALAAFLRRSDFGLGVLAAADDPTSVRLVGVRISRVAAFTWGTGCALSALAALLLTPTIGVFAPGFGGGLFVGALAAALVGGLASLPGAFVGGIVVGLVEAFARKATLTTTALPGASTLAIFAVIVAVLLLRPQGLLTRTARA